MCKIEYFGNGDDKWYVGHHIEMNDIPIKAKSFRQAVQLFEDYIIHHCSDDTYVSDISGVEEIDEQVAKELSNYYICED